MKDPRFTVMNGFGFCHHGAGRDGCLVVTNVQCRRCRWAWCPAHRDQHACEPVEELDARPIETQPRRRAA